MEGKNNCLTLKERQQYIFPLKITIMGTGLYLFKAYHKK